MRVIGFSGPDGCGKSSLRVALQQHLEPYAVLSVPFADQLRVELTDVLVREWQRGEAWGGGWPNLWEKPTPPHIRQLLRGWGDLKRSVDPLYWVRAWEGRLEALRKDDQQLLIIADDIRYRNEVEAVHALGGMVLYLDDVAVPDHQLLHELLDVRAMADVGFTVDSRAGRWVKPEEVVELLAL